MHAARDDFNNSSWDSVPSQKRLLLDIATDAFLLIFHINKGGDPGAPDELRQEIARMLQHLEKQAKRFGYGDEDIKATRYAICALIDETILNSRWQYKDQWSDRPLQLEHFGEHMAGERFFDLLERVRQKGARKVDLLEIFCVSIILGFQGRYKLRGREELQKMIQELAREITASRGRSAALSPHWRVPEEPVEQPKNAIPLWFWITGAVSISLVLIAFVVFKIILRSDLSTALSRLVF
jgi:type VI secretion system protein ImpK